MLKTEDTVYAYSRVDSVMSLKILNRKENALLRRQEVQCEFSGLNGKLTRQDAISALQKSLKLDREVVRLTKIEPKSGTQDLTAEFYVYSNPEDEKRQLPRYYETRALSKEERKKIFDERRKSKTSPSSSGRKK